MMTETDAAVGLALSLIALLTALVGWLRWVRPRYRNARRQASMALYSLVGRDEVVDPSSGRVLAEAQPGIGARMEKVENAVVKVVGLIESQQRQDFRLDSLEHRVAQLEEAAIERVATKAESVAAWRAVEAVASQPPTDPESGD